MAGDGPAGPTERVTPDYHPATVTDEGRSVRDRSASLLAGAVRACDRARPPAGLVVMYHEIGAQQGDRERELVPALSEEAFRRQLAHLTRRYEVVPLSQLRERIAVNGTGLRAPAALTFDDDVASHLTSALPTLAEMGLPATFFLTGASLNGPEIPWWAALQEAMGDDAEAPHRLKEQLAAECAEFDWPTDVHGIARIIEQLPPDERDRVAERLRQIGGGEQLHHGLSTEAVRELGAAGFEIGFHTRHHYNLVTLNDDELRTAMEDGLAELTEAVGYRPRSIAYPHCKADERVARAARAAGFEVGLVCSNGPVTRRQNPLLLDRVDAWADSLGAFELRLARALSRAWWTR